MNLPDPSSAATAVTLAEDLARLRALMRDFPPSPQLTADPQAVLLAFAAARRIARHLRTATARGSDIPAAPAVLPSDNQMRQVLADWLAYLPKVQGWLQTEKRRLESRRAHAAAVQRWAESIAQAR